MSAGAGSTGALTVSADPNLLAPKFRQAVLAGLVDCHAAGLDAYVFEAHRSQELQSLYYARGRTVIPPARTVTNVQNAQYGWHFFGLAVDVISMSKHWGAPPEWFVSVSNIFKAHGCKWGGDWKRRDTPHVQWGLCRPTPSDLSRQAFARGGNPAVWALVQAA